MFRKIAFAAAATSALAAPALAGSMTPAPADPAPMAPVPVPVAMGGDWTGGYGGLSLGYGNVDGGTLDSDGTLYGVHAGYDYDFGQFVMGGELEYQGADIETPGLTVDDITRVKLRAGYDAGPALLYGVVGGARANTNLGADNGYVAGLGAEYKVTNNVSVGGEYLYHGFNDFNSTGTDLDVNTVSARVNYRF